MMGIVLFVGLARILSTSRLYPYELQLPSLQPRPGAAAVFLEGMSMITVTAGEAG